MSPSHRSEAGIYWAPPADGPSCNLAASRAPTSGGSAWRPNTPERATRYTHRPRNTDRAERPLGGYLLVMAAFAAVVGLGGLVAALTGRGLPRRIAPYDLALITAGTQSCPA